MTTSRHSALALDAETLLSHGAWLAKFARALVADPDEIDDVVQETYATALARPPRHAGNLRGWLATVARNVVRSKARSASARVAREVAVPPPAPIESPAEAVERAELRRMVVESVLALDEPYRSTVILRFFEEQDVAGVSRLTSAGEDTVRTRIRRGVQRVREMLERKVADESRGSADEGSAALALLFVRLRAIAATADSPAASGSAAHVTRFRIVRGAVVGAAAVLVGVATWRLATPRPPPSDVEQETASRTSPDTGSRDVPPPAAVVAARESEAARPPEAPVTAPAPAGRSTRLGSIRGAVRDADGNPVEGAYVWALDCPSHRALHSMPVFGEQAKLVAEADPARRVVSGWTQTRSGKGGSFEFESLSVVPAWEVGAYDPALGAIVTDVHEFDRDHHDVVVDVQLVRGSKVRGDVQDEGGNPVGGARIFLFSTCGKRSTRGNFVTNRDGPKVGAFDAGFHCGDTIEVACTAPGFLPIKRSGFDRANGKVAVVHLRMKRLPGSSMRGRIVDPAGHSVDFEALLRARFIQERADLRSLKATVWAIASDAKPPPALAAGDSGGPGVFEGRIDFAESKYEVVVPADFHGSVEVRVFRSVFGSTAVADSHASPVVTCDEAALPVDDLPTTFAVRFVDSETKEPIDLEHESSLPQANDKASFVPIVAARCDARHGLVTYRCLPGPLHLEPILEGYAYHAAAVDVPREQPAPPLSIEMAPARSGVHGFVLRSDGSPLGLATLTVHRRSGSGWVEETGPLTRANADGEFEFDRLTKGDHVLVVSAQPDEAPGVGSFVASDPFPELTVRATPGRNVRFRVVAPPTSGQIVQAGFRILNGDGLVVEDLTGRWNSLSPSNDEITLKLEDGHFTADFERIPYRATRFEFDVPAGRDVEIPLTLPPDRTK